MHNSLNPQPTKLVELPSFDSLCMFYLFIIHMH